MTIDVLPARDALRHSQLGKPTAYADHYDAGLLYPIARAPQRVDLGVGAALPFFGADLWTAYELSWLNPRGKPQVAIARMLIPCESTFLIESKSFKLYLNSYSGTCFESADAVKARIEGDVSRALWGDGPIQSRAGVQLLAPEAFGKEKIRPLAGFNLDRLDIECDRDHPAPELLTADFDAKPVEEVLSSHLLKSNCPVTGQPDWGSVEVRYIGPQIDQGRLLQYIVSFRHHSEFHEHCVERMFHDIQARCQPSELSVYARYTRRGGLEINPYRTSHPGGLPSLVRTARQ